MSDVLKGLTGGWNFLVSWVFPSALAWSVFALFVFPKLQHVPIFKDLGSTSAGNQALVLVGASILTGLLLNGLSTVLFRVIEGYYLRPPIDVWMRRRQQRQQQKLMNKLRRLQDERENWEQRPAEMENPRGETKPKADESPPSGTVAESKPSQLGIDVKIGLLRERLQRYPPDYRQFGPTQFANALRAIETYGWDRYRLDSQTFWSELISAVPDSLRAEEESARAPMNFSVSMMCLSALLGVVCLIVDFSTSSSVALIAVGLVSVFLVPAWYRLAVLNTRYLSSVVQAIVNVGRVELAKKMGLSVPRKLEEERAMWEQMFWFVGERFEGRTVGCLDDYRLEKKEDDGS